jgi:hypothetical protein
MGLGDRKELPSHQRIVYWAARNQAETDAFLQSRPQGPLGKLGQAVLVAHGKKHVLSIDELKERSRLPLGDTGMEVELERIDERFLGAVLWIHAPGEQRPSRLLLLADHPEFNQQDEKNGVYGTYWFDAAQRAPAAADDAAQAEIHPERPRIDILEGADKRLYYRTWQSPSVGAIGALPVGKKFAAFEKTDSQLAFYVDRFTPRTELGGVIVPLPFSKGKDKGIKERRARVRLTVDGKAEEFWLAGLPANPFGDEPNRHQRRVVQGNGRSVAVTLPWDQIDVGFKLYLHKFDRKLDPGTSQASHYSSTVSRLPMEEPASDSERRALLDEKVPITLNEPVNFSDPRTGRSYRIYQEAFRGPWRPGDPEFESLVRMSSREELPDELFLSWLTVNYDPGRGLKYIGCLMIVAGVATMFYMRAYFFRPRGSQKPETGRRRDALPAETVPALRG